MSSEQGWLQRQRQGLWHLRKGGVKRYREWQQRQSRDQVTPNIRYGMAVPSTVISDIDVPVIAGLATMPSRVRLLREAFNSIYWQVDEVYIYLNNFVEVPEFLNRPKVRIFRSQDHYDYKDVGKFFALRQLKQGILVTIDDDILYPPDYVSTMLSHLAATNFQAVVGVHGFQLARLPKSFFDRHMFHFRRKVDSVAFASVLGTGTTVFDIENVGITFDDFTSYGMADIHFAAHLKKRQIPALVVSRPAEWLKPLSFDDNGDEDPSLYDQTLHNGAPHNTILRSLVPWGEEDTLSRWQGLANDHHIEAPLVYALEAIRLAGSDTPNVFSHIPKEALSDHFKDINPWLDVYADQPTRYRIMLDALAAPSIGVARRFALASLWTMDTAKAVEMSRHVVSKRTQDIQALRQHANFCSGFYLLDEAEEHYLSALRLSGARRDKSTFDILFEYFKFLVRFEEFDKARILASTLQAKYAENPLFQAWMVLVHLFDNDSSGAESKLTSLAESEHARRGAGIAVLVRAVADLNVQFPRLTGPLVTSVAVRACIDSAEDLVALIKIATVFKDHDGAVEAWCVLRERHFEYTLLHPELVWFYASNWETSGDLMHDTHFESLSVIGQKAPFSVHRHISTMGGSRTSSDVGPLVSVILTAFNSQDTLGFAVQSILGQTHTSLELIIVDDKSTDDTAKLVEEWQKKDSRVTLIRNAHNMGPYASRNVGIQHANGEFIAIQDADDVSTPTRVELQLSRFASDTQAVLAQHVRADVDGALHLENDGSVLGHGPVTLIVRRKALDELGAFADVRTRGDKEFESRLEHYYGAHALLRIPEVTVCALHEEGTNSRVQISTLDKKRDLMLFKQNYTRNHSRGLFDLA